MLLADARLPSGGHTQSAGLEAALAGGMPVGGIPEYIAFRLRTTATVEAGVAVAALAALAALAAPRGLTGPPGAPGPPGLAGLAGRTDPPGLGAGVQLDDTPDRLRDVEQQWAARTPSHVQRQASNTLGRGYLRMLRTLFPDHRATALLSGLGSPCRPMMIGGLAHVLCLGNSQLIRLICYDEVATIGSAALKLAPLDPLTTVGWALTVRPVVEAVVQQISTVRHVTDLPAPAAPLMESWVHAHARRNRRLFSA